MTPVEFIARHDVRGALARAAAAYEGPVDHHWYEPVWDRQLQEIATLIESGETELLRVVDRIRASPEKRNVFTDVDERLWFGERLRMNRVLRSHLRHALINAVLYDACRDETESVVELGAGNGINLFEFWLTASPRRARYLAFEIASTGRLCTELMATLEPSMHVSAHAFDYRTPDYALIPNGQQHMLVFTTSSIEQVAELPRAVIDDLLGKADAVSGVHFEPVGWQLPEQDNPAHRRLCTNRGYNQNFWSLLTEFQQAGRIAIDRTVVNIYGRINHPTTLIEWHKLP